MRDIDELTEKLEQLEEQVGKQKKLLETLMKNGFLPQKLFLKDRVLPLLLAWENKEGVFAGTAQLPNPRMMAFLEAWENKEGIFAEKKKRTRIPMNREDWERVHEMLNSGSSNWKSIAEDLGLPESTCRKYGKMSELDGLALPQLSDDDEEE